MQNPKVILKEIEKNNKGLFAGEDITKDEILFEFEGPVLHWGDSQQFDGWTDDIHNHAVQIGPTTWISNINNGRYINHSCNPNCGIKNLIQVVAMTNIKVGEELTYDYEMTESNDWRMKCLCGNKNCRGVIGAYKNMPQNVKDRYKGYISEWLLK